ncbi:hypothetical protein VCV18_011829 [Metarhizium anisopliae]
MDSDNDADILILTAVFGFASTLFMVLRLAIRKIKKRPLDISDYLTLIAIACVQARTAFTTVVVLWGNNNDYLFDEHPDPTEIYHLVVGSKLTLANRFIYNTYLWIQKAVVLLFYRQIFSVLPAAAQIIAIYWIVLCATYLAAQAACVLDCVPLRLYWQVVPNPGVFLIAIALARLPVYKDGTSQDRRHIWGSIEQFCSALGCLARSQGATEVVVAILLGVGSRTKQLAVPQYYA